MANSIIEVTVNSSPPEPSSVPASPTYCAVVIVNCDAMHVDSIRQEINGPVPASFMNVPPGRYFIVVVPEGGDARHTWFTVIDGNVNLTPVTFNISTADVSGKITAIVLVGGQRAPGKTVMIMGRNDGYTKYSMTDIDGVAEFNAVPETQIYDVIAYHASVSQEDACPLDTNANCGKQFYFNACSACGR